MVDFTLTDEQKSMREMSHDFAEKEIRPVAWEYDKEGTWPQDVIEKAWELGLMNSHLSSEYGGPGLGFLDGALFASSRRLAVRFIGWILFSPAVAKRHAIPQAIHGKIGPIPFPAIPK